MMTNIKVLKIYKVNNNYIYKVNNNLKSKMRQIKERQKERQNKKKLN